MKQEVLNNQKENRFEVGLDGHTGTLEYRLGPGAIVLIHTEVPEAMEGQGIGSSLVKYGLEYARSNNLKVIPRCSFVQAYLRRHPEYNELVQA